MFSRKGRRLNLIMIIIGLIIVVLSSLHLDSQLRSILRLFGFINGGYFAVEYIFRLYYRYQQLRKYAVITYIKSFLGIIDLLAIFPFILPLVIPLDKELFALITYCQVLVVFKLKRYILSFDMLSTAIGSVKNQLIVATTVPLIFAVFSALMFYYVESPLQPIALKNISDSFYWVVITMTTVGYGDIIPFTSAGRILTVLTSISGIFLIAIPAGILSSAFNVQMKRDKKRDDMRNYIFSRAEKTHIKR